MCNIQTGVGVSGSALLLQSPSFWVQNERYNYKNIISGPVVALRMSVDVGHALNAVVVECSWLVVYSFLSSSILLQCRTKHFRNCIGLTFYRPFPPRPESLRFPMASFSAKQHPLFFFYTCFIEHSANIINHSDFVPAHFACPIAIRVYGMQSSWSRIDRSYSVCVRFRRYCSMD